MPEFRFAELKPDEAQRKRLGSDEQARHDGLFHALDYEFYPKEGPTHIEEAHAAGEFLLSGDRDALKAARPELRRLGTVRALLDESNPSVHTLIAVKNLGKYLSHIGKRNFEHAHAGKYLYNLILAKAVHLHGRWAIESTHRQASLKEKAKRFVGLLPKWPVTSNSRHDLQTKFEKLAAEGHLPKAVRDYFDEAADKLATY